MAQINSKVVFFLHTAQQWYDIQAIARNCFGQYGNWLTQSHVLRKLRSLRREQDTPVIVWFKVPDPHRFASWVLLYHSIKVQFEDANTQ